MADEEMYEGPLTTAEARIDIPGDVMIDGIIMVCSYYGPDGQQRYAWQTRGEYSAATGIGLLEIVKGEIIKGLPDG